MIFIAVVCRYPFHITVQCRYACVGALCVQQVITVMEAVSEGCAALAGGQRGIRVRGHWVHNLSRNSLFLSPFKICRFARVSVRLVRIYMYVYTTVCLGLFVCWEKG